MAGFKKRGCVHSRSLMFANMAAVALVPVGVQPASAQLLPETVASVCTGVSLPPSVVTGIMDPVLTGIVNPIETTTNSALGVISIIPIVGTTIPDLSINLSGLLSSAAAGDPIGLSAIALDGSLIGPSDECNSTADSYTLDNPAGITIGGNQITGLGANGEQASAGEIDSIAIGNQASTHSTATESIAIGTGATVGSGAQGSVAFGSGASATAANSVALGADSVASRGAQSGYTAFGLASPQTSAGEVSVGVPGAERQITNVAAGSAPTDAVNMAQLQAVASQIGTGNPVEYDDSTFATVTLAGPSGTTVTNVADGALSATSSDAVNGSQLFATNQQVSANTTAINILTTTIAAGVGPAQYSDDATPTVPNGNVVSNDVTLVGASPGGVQLHNIAAGTDATDAVNLSQLQAVASLIGGSTTNAVTYNDSTFTTVTLAGPSGTTINNLAAGAVSAGSTDAVNGSQLFATNQQISNLTTSITNGAIGPVQYSDDSSPTVPNGGTPSNDLTLVGGSAGPVQLHNVADGVIAPGSTDAVNGGQLAAVAAVADNAVTYDTDSGGQRLNTVTLVGGNTSEPVTLRNVAAGVAPTDAVNVEQLQDMVGQSVSVANAYTDARFAALDYDLKRARNEARAGTAAALAAAALPQAFEAGKKMIAVGAGTYRGKSAFALGASGALRDGKTVVKVGLTYDTTDHVGANAGLGWQF